MAFFELCSDITIGSFRFGGVHEVRIKRSIHSYAESAIITLPSICKILEGSRATPKILTTSQQFKAGDSVTINLGYNHPIQEKGGKTPIIKGGNDANSGGFICTVFQGFVKSKVIGMPLRVECEGYVRKLRLDVNVTVSEKEIKAGKLLKMLEQDKDGKPTGIKVEVKDDIDLAGVKFSGNNGVELIEAVRRMSQGTLNIFFKDPTTLWCGFTYTPYSKGIDPLSLGEASYRLGYNAPKDSSLKERAAASERIKVVFASTDTKGIKREVSGKDAGAGTIQRTVVSNVHDPASLERMVQEKQLMASYTGYEGSINGFLQPWCEPGWRIIIKDKQYRERDGTYLVEATEVSFGMNGARIKVDVGPKLGFGKDE
ncbi:MAG: hypothetical protein K0Q79_1499 [Flavipsychrobacter sp.]|nr:hypothetical protein [Flavipsychrobacter sp.]